MVLELQYAYAALCLPFGIVWIVFYLISPKDRSKMLSVSYKRAPFGILLDCIYTADYWNPQTILFLQLGGKKLMLESMLFAFFLSGIAAVAFRIFFLRNKAYHDDCKAEAVDKFSLMASYFFAIFAAILLMNSGINSIFSTALCYSIIGMALVIRIPSLFPCCFFTSVFISLLMFSVYIGGRMTIFNIEEILQAWWMLYDTDLDVRIMNIPATELIWGLGYGFTASAKHNLSIRIH